MQPLTPIATRLARPADAPAIAALIERSARGLNRGHYSAVQIESALRHAFGVDSQLIADGTYFVAEVPGQIVGAGGWSRRARIYGADDKGPDPEAEPLLDPARDAARIRGFFVDPDWSRRGIGQMLLRLCERSARQAGFMRLELLATLTGVPLYLSGGFEPVQAVILTLPDNMALPGVRMAKQIPM